MCDPCPIGTYRAEPGAVAEDQCLPCPTGTFAGSEGAAQCDGCPWGSYVTLFSRWFAGAARFVNQPLSVKLTDYAGQRDVLKQIAFDVLIHPIWCTSELPAFPRAAHLG